MHTVYKVKDDVEHLDLLDILKKPTLKALSGMAYVWPCAFQSPHPSPVAIDIACRLCLISP